jgi:hypothetical protein
MVGAGRRRRRDGWLRKRTHTGAMLLIRRSIRMVWIYSKLGIVLAPITFRARTELA